jgi:flagellin
MGLRIFNNVDAVNAHRHLSNTNMQASKAMERLSSGLRINRAADDAAGLAVSETMRSRIRGETVAMRNAQDGISMVQVADGAMGTAVDMLQRVRDLAVQAANGTLTDSQRGNLQNEVTAILSEVDATGANTEFNTHKILNSSYSGTIQVGASSGQVVTFATTTVSQGSLGVSGISVGTMTGAQAAIASIDSAISTLTTNRAQMGAVQNRLEQVIARLGVTTENLSAAESRIRDADMALEMVSFTKAQILQQSGTAMLAQANQSPQSVLSLLR